MNNLKNDMMATKSTDDIIKDALNERDVRKMNDLEKCLTERMQQNKWNLNDRVDSALTAIERKINYHYQAQNSKLTRIIAYATILTAAAGAILGYWQNRNTQQQILLQQEQFNLQINECKSIDK